MNLNIWQKGLILVGVPLIFELVFLIILSGMLHQAEYEALQEARAKTVMVKLSDIVRLFYDASTSLVNHVLSNDPSYSSSYEQSIARVSDEFHSLEGLTAGTTAEGDDLKRVEKAGGLVLDSFNKAKLMLEQHNRRYLLFNLDSLRNGLKGNMDAFLNETAKLTQEERRVQTQGLLSSGQLRNLIVKSMYLAIAFSIGLAVVLVIFFSKGINDRLAVLVDNARRLAKKEQLNPALPGKDEISFVDSAFHEMADTLSEMDRVKQEFVAMVSHDLRTPLSSIQFSLTLALDGAYGELPELAVKELKIAERNGTRLLTLVNDLLDVERMEAGQMQLNLAPAKLAGLVQRAVEAVKPFAEQNEINLEVSVCDTELLADGDRLEQVIINLLSNAVKFSPAKSLVRIEVTDSQDAVEVKVADQGKGIPKEYQDMIFDRFKQAEVSHLRRHKGSGLGLAICKAIVEAHGGTISVESEPEQGSTFRFSIPKSGAAGSSQSPAAG